MAERTARQWNAQTNAMINAELASQNKGSDTEYSYFNRDDPFAKAWMQRTGADLGKGDYLQYNIATKQVIPQYKSQKKAGVTYKTFGKGSKEANAWEASSGQKIGPGQWIQVSSTGDTQLKGTFLKKDEKTEKDPKQEKFYEAKGDYGVYKYTEKPGSDKVGVGAYHPSEKSEKEEAMFQNVISQLYGKVDGEFRYNTGPAQRMRDAFDKAYGSDIKTGGASNWVQKINDEISKRAELAGSKNPTEQQYKDADIFKLGPRYESDVKPFLDKIHFRGDQFVYTPDKDDLQKSKEGLAFINQAIKTQAGVEWTAKEQAAWKKGKALQNPAEYGKAPRAVFRLEADEESGMFKVVKAEGVPEEVFDAKGGDAYIAHINKLFKRGASQVKSYNPELYRSVADMSRLNAASGAKITQEILDLEKE